jgi:hypothetical protein
MLQIGWKGIEKVSSDVYLHLVGHVAKAVMQCSDQFIGWDDEMLDVCQQTDIMRNDTNQRIVGCK